jgi:hypothetical protein
MTNWCYFFSLIRKGQRNYGDAETGKTPQNQRQLGFRYFYASKLDLYNMASF